MKDKNWLLFGAIPFLFALHNLEEALFMGAFLPSYKNTLPVLIRNFLGEISYPQFLAVLLPISILPFILLIIWKKDRSQSWIPFVLCGLQFVIFLNIFSHVGSAFLLKSYSPGLLTALLVNLPFSILFFFRQYRCKFITLRNIPLFIAGALLAHGPLLLGLMKIAGFFIS